MRKKKIAENYLEKIPALHSSLSLTCDEAGMATLAIENKGMMNRIAQKLFHKPKISYIHLDALGSTALCAADGTKTILAIGEVVKAQHGEAAEPLYERLAKFFYIMDSYHFIVWKQT